MRNSAIFHFRKQMFFPRHKLFSVSEAVVLPWLSDWGIIETSEILSRGAFSPLSPILLSQTCLFLPRNIWVFFSLGFFLFGLFLFWVFVCLGGFWFVFSLFGWGFLFFALYCIHLKLVLDHRAGWWGNGEFWWVLSPFILTHVPSILFFLSCPVEEGSDRTALVGIQPGPPHPRSPSSSSWKCWVCAQCQLLWGSFHCKSEGRFTMHVQTGFSSVF